MAKLPNPHAVSQQFRLVLLLLKLFLILSDPKNLLDIRSTRQCLTLNVLSVHIEAEQSQSLKLITATFICDSLIQLDVALERVC